ncbi:MAG: hypothetical protein LQ347_004345 [Umbilicaria vellea]|nr:MAG: hypothetical protein LQ347_004345 [Umbilicaria vellea]
MVRLCNQRLALGPRPHSCFQSWRRPPGTLPFAGNGIWFLQPRHKLLDWFTECQDKVGFETFEISVPSLPPAIVINDPQNVEHVLKNNDLFIKGAFFRQRSWDLFGNGIINADGELWRIQRKAGLRFFSNANLKAFVDEILPPFLEDTKQTLHDIAKQGDAVDLQHVFHELTTRLMGKMAYDMDMHGSLPFSKAFDFASGEIGERFQNPFWKLKELLLGAPLRKAVFEVKTFGSAIVSVTVQKNKHDQINGKGSGRMGIDSLRTNLINSLLDNIEDHQVVADAAMNYLSAGRDTTAQSLTWTLYLLMRHPGAVTRIRKELQISFPNAKQHLPLSFDNVQPSSLPYTMAVFNESLRLYPPVPVELKECTAPTTFPDGTTLPIGAVVMWVPWAMNRSKRIWGDDPEVFRPERWFEDSSDTAKPTMRSMTAFEFPVFNGGPRSCLGKKMAELLAVYVIASLVWEFDFDEVLDEKMGGCGVGKSRLSQNSLTLPMEGGLPSHVRKA